MVACIHHGLRGAACILRRATPLVCLAVFAHWPEQPECSLRRQPPDKRRFWCQLVSAALLRENRGHVPASTPRICMYTSTCTYNTYAGIEVRTRGYDDRDAAGAFSRPGGAPARGVGVRSARGLGHHSSSGSSAVWAPPHLPRRKLRRGGLPLARRSRCVDALRAAAAADFTGGANRYRGAWPTKQMPRDMVGVRIPIPR